MRVGEHGDIRGTTYESNVLYTLRFMIDLDVVGGNWVELPAGSYWLPQSRASYCQIEAHVRFDRLVSHAAEGDWARLAPLRVLSFDIECAGRKVRGACKGLGGLAPGFVSRTVAILWSPLPRWALSLDAPLALLSSLPLPLHAPCFFLFPSFPLSFLPPRSQGHFPEAKLDPVIQIASMVTVQGQDQPVVKNVMTLGSCASIVGAEVMAFER